MVVFGSISSQGWTYDDQLHKDVCIMNNQSATCHFSTFVGVVGFVASIAFLVGEWFFEQMSSIKTRKHFVIADMAFSSLWAFFYLVACLIMSVAWSKSDEKYDYGSKNILGAIFFALLSVFSWVRIGSNPIWIDPQFSLMIHFLGRWCILCLSAIQGRFGWSLC